MKVNEKEAGDGPFKKIQDKTNEQMCTSFNPEMNDPTENTFYR